MMIQARRWVKRRAIIVLLLALLIPLASVSTTVRADGRSYTWEDVEIIAKTIWGEARGCDATQQAAVVWCILNRVDSDLFPNSIREVVTQPYQFSGYNATNPVDPEIIFLVQDVLARWSIEQSCVAGVGRVLPASYLFFSGNGSENRFREQYNSTVFWDWSIPSPYAKDTAAGAGSSDSTNAPAPEQRGWIPCHEQIG